MARHRHRKLKGKKLKNQRRIIIVSLLVLTLLLSTGYAAFSTNISLSAKGNIKEKPKSALEIILENEEVQESISTVDGLYKDTIEDPIDGKYRYIYKGADPDNYIEFNDETWRIYSIEPDGSLKITRSELLSGRAFDSNDASRKSGYCARYGYCNAWAATSNLVGFPSAFTNESVTGSVTDSEMLTYLNSNTSGNYYYSLTDTAKGQIASHDWNVGPAGTTQDTYALSQLVSTDYEGKYKWNGKVALLTKSEYMRASSNSSCVTAKYWYDNRSSTTCKGSDYLFNSSTNWWLFSPVYADSSLVIYASNVGLVNSHGADAGFSVRLALYLSPDITITGKGTNDSNIYKIS